METPRINPELKLVTDISGNSELAKVVIHRLKELGLEHNGRTFGGSYVENISVGWADREIDCGCAPIRYMIDKDFEAFTLENLYDPQWLKAHSVKKEEKPALPNKLFELLEVALRDLEKCEENPDQFKIDMYEWYSPKTSGTCSVCLAGSVMAQTLGSVTKEKGDGGLVMPHYFEPEIGDKLRAIDVIRAGNIQGALNCLGINPGPNVHFAPSWMPEYSTNPRRFKKAIRDIIYWLKDRGW